MHVGLAMFTVRNSFKKDPENTFKEVANAGYHFIEIANHHADMDTASGLGIPTEDIKKMASDNGITIIGAHFKPTGGTKELETFYYNDDQIKRIIEVYTKLGGKYLSIPIDFWPTKNYLLRRCELYNHIGSLCAPFGIKLLYHNHYHEYALLEGRPAMDVLVENTDPGLVGIEIDTYWTILGTYDPAEKIRQYGHRVDIIHQKDFPLSRIQNMNIWARIDQRNIAALNYEAYKAQIKPENFIEIGKGIIKIQDIIDAGNEFNIPYILVEQDYTTLTEFESIRVSMDSFRKMRGLEFN
jgi:sugar phosphate isomerase/epimerase